MRKKWKIILVALVLYWDGWIMAYGFEHEWSRILMIVFMVIIPVVCGVILNRLTEELK